MTFDKYGASPLSSDHGYQTIWDIVDITELKLRTEAEWNLFLRRQSGEVSDSSEQHGQITGILVFTATSI